MRLPALQPGSYCKTEQTGLLRQCVEEKTEREGARRELEKSLEVSGEVDGNEGDAHHRQDNSKGIKADGRKIYALLFELME